MVNLKLGNWWHLTLTSSYLFWRLGAMLPILCMFGWLFAHLLWLDRVENNSWLILVLIVSLFSSYFYANAFVILNYNSLGWLFVPMGFYNLFTENYFIAALAWFGASLGSTTVVFIVGWVCLAWSLINLNLYPLFSLIPAIIKC